MSTKKNKHKLEGCREKRECVTLKEKYNDILIKKNGCII